MATETPDPDETSRRPLRHCATSVQHGKHPGADVVGVRVERLR